MAKFEFNWPTGSEYSEDMRNQLEVMFNSIPKPELLKEALGKIHVTSFRFGKMAPEIELSGINDLNYEKDVPFHIKNTEMCIQLKYNSDFEIGIQTTVQINFCALDSEEDMETFGIASAHKKFTVPVSFSVTDIQFDAKMTLIYDGNSGTSIKMTEAPIKKIKIQTSINHLGLQFLSDRLQSTIQSTLNQFFVHQLPLLLNKSLAPKKSLKRNISANETKKNHQDI